MNYKLIVPCEASFLNYRLLRYLLIFMNISVNYRDIFMAITMWIRYQGIVRPM